MSIVSVNNLKMSYEKGKVQALKGVSFDVEKGEIFGLIGPDGAGKTSLSPTPPLVPSGSKRPAKDI